jgi:hypothetical protein
MNQTAIVRRPRLFVFILVLFLIIQTGCNLPSSLGGVSVWIDVPLNGLIFPDVQEIKIEGHASSPAGIDHVEIWINDTLLTSSPDLSVEGDLVNFHTAWAPSDVGEYTIQTIAFNASGTASRPDSVRVTFGGGAPTPVSGCPTPLGGGPTPVSCLPAESGCPTPVGGGPTPVSCVTAVASVTPLITDTPTSVPGPEVKFWADPAQIEAGACTTINWQVENASRIVFGGIEQPAQGSYQDCFCKTQSYVLRVTDLDGVEQAHEVTVLVNGACVTPSPSEPTLTPFKPTLTPTDSTPPPAPVLAVPDNGLTLACRAAQSLVWQPVSDPSGIARYEIQVQRHSGDNNWKDVPGSVFSATDKSMNLSVECGWYYRWRVRAVDGAGNVGSWSGWSLFTVTLG